LLAPPIHLTQQPLAKAGVGSTLAPSAFSAAVFGTAALGKAVLGKAVLGKAALGKAALDTVTMLLAKVSKEALKNPNHCQDSPNVA
jgi:hypothetical protein